MPDFVFKKNSAYQILKLYFFDMSVFERKRIQGAGFLKQRVRFCVKKLQCVRFGIEENYNASVFEYKKDNALDFELKHSDISNFEYKKIQRVRCWIQGKQRIRFWKKKFPYASDFEINIFRLVGFWIKNFSTCQILNWWKRHRIRFWIKKLKPVRFCSISFTTCQILKRNFFLWSDFQLKFVQRVRLWIIG